MKRPRDSHPYPQDARARRIGPDLPDGGYVYVQSEEGEVFVLPDGPHLHPKVLGEAKPALYAGDLTIRRGRVIDVTNLSGTFQFDDPDGLIQVARAIRDEGLVLSPQAVRFFPADGSRPVALQLAG